VSTYDREPDPSDYDKDYADIHSCSYSCWRPQCIEAQRKELFAYAHEIYQAVTALEPKHNMTMRQVMEYAVERLKEKI